MPCPQNDEELGVGSLGREEAWAVHWISLRADLYLPQELCRKLIETAAVDYTILCHFVSTRPWRVVHQIYIRLSRLLFLFAEL